MAYLASKGAEFGADNDRRHASGDASHRRELFKKRPVCRRIGHEGGLHSKLRAVCRGRGHQLVMIFKRGPDQVHKCAVLMLPARKAKELLADKGYDMGWLATSVAERVVVTRFPGDPIQRSRSPTTPSSASSATNRNHVRAAQRPAIHPHALRLMRPHGNLYCSSARLLALNEPSSRACLNPQDQHFVDSSLRRFGV